jgi:transposase
MSMQKQRRKFSAPQKVQLLRQHLVEKISISQICDQNGIQPTQFYQWQKVFFENGTAAFEKSGNGRKDGRDKKLENKISHLQTKLAHKDEVIAEIMASHVALKKSLGED